MEGATVQAGEVLLGSLSLLGVAVPAASREYGCELGADMFVHQNQKALNTVLHLLFERILGKERLKKEIKGAWPVKDSVHQRDFNKVMHLHMLALADQGVMPKYLAHALGQCFRQISGPKLTLVLCFLAAHALSKDASCTPAQAKLVSQDVPNYPQAAEAVFKVVRAQNTLQRQAFVAGLEGMSAAQAGWEEAAQKLSSDYRAAWQQLCELTARDPSVLPESAAEPAPAPEAPAEDELQSAQQELVQSHQAADALWLAVKAGAASNLELRKRLATIVATARHPHTLDGAELLAAAGQAGVQPEAGELPEVQLAATLQDFAALLAACKDALPEQQEVERLRAQSRALTPLLAPEQLAQVASIGGQHARRLQGQQEAAAALHQLLSASGCQQQVLLSKVDAALGLAPPQAAEPGSPAGDLIKAKHPAGERPAASEDGDAPTADAGAVLDKQGQASLDLKAALSLPGPDNVKARLARAAFPSSFDGHAQILRPYVANTAATVLEPAGAAPAFAARFLPEELGQRQGVDALKASQRQDVAVALRASKAPRTDPGAQPAAVAFEPAEPRRLSFSGTTPSAAHGEGDNAKVPQDKLPTGETAPLRTAGSGWQAADEESVAKLRERLRQLRTSRG